MRSSGCWRRRPQAKSRNVRLADRAARLYAPVVHAAAALTAIGWLIAGASFHDAIVTAIAVLIITCPCALALAIPAVQVVAAGQLFRAGVILNCGDAIERHRRGRHRRLRQDRHADHAGSGGRCLGNRSRAPRARGAARSVEPSSSGGRAGAAGARARALSRRDRKAGRGRACPDRRRGSAPRQRKVLRHGR